MPNRRTITAIILTFVVSTSAAVFGLHAQRPLHLKGTITASQHKGNPLASNVFTDSYYYAGPRFNKLVMESYHHLGSENWRSFYQQMDSAYNKYRSKASEWHSTTLIGMLDSEKRRIAAIADNSKRAKAEKTLAANLHKFVKTAIPNFSLDRGFEFYYAQTRGERQCFLQSVLIAGMLQRAGIQAGIAMVYKNTRGELTNNGHAVDLVQLSNGRHIIIDASEHEPFAKQRGLFVKLSNYVYADPVFKANSEEIDYYKSASGRETLLPAKIKALDYDFIRSQFWYYRGERSVGGLVLLPKTVDGLKASERALRISVEICPKNPLAVFTLGRVYLSEGKTQAARKSVLEAYHLYLQFGWVPEGITEYLALVGQPDAARTGS